MHLLLLFKNIIKINLTPIFNFIRANNIEMIFLSIKPYIKLNLLY